MKEWREVKGYEGLYEVSYEGLVRRLWKHREPTILSPYKRRPRKGGRRSAREFVKLSDGAGKGREVAVIKIVGEAWLGPLPPGMVYYHKNGDTGDHHANNIGKITPKKLGQKTGASANRRPVCKIDCFGNVVKFYPSARAAARDNYVSYQTVMDRCNGKVKKPFALDGHSYQWDK